MAIPAAVLTTVAAQIPWKDVIAAAPEVWKTAKDLFASTTNKAEAPPVDPGADVRDQLAALARRVQEGEQAQAEQAKVLAALAGQMQAMTTQVQANAARAKQLLWVAGAGSVLALAALVLAIAR